MFLRRAWIQLIRFHPPVLEYPALPDRSPPEIQPQPNVRIQQVVQDGRLHEGYIPLPEIGEYLCAGEGRILAQDERIAVHRK